jgi:hypothetical protein
MVKQQFAHGPGKLLLTGPYQKNPQADVSKLHQLSLEWIKNHKTDNALRKKLQTSGASQHV